MVGELSTVTLTRIAPLTAPVTDPLSEFDPDAVSSEANDVVPVDLQNASAV